MKRSRHLEQVLAHAASRLAATGARRPTEVLPLYKKFLNVEEHRLRLKHQAGGGGREICSRRAELVDVLLQYVFGAAEASARGNGASKVSLALVALWGYGRGELNPFSDIDVMLLHHQEKKGISPHLEEMVQQVLYLLWDSGFKVGHSTRSIKEAVAQANQDMRTKTAMLESRFLAGDADLAREFRRQFRSKCVDGSEREYVELRIQDHYEHTRNIFRVTERITEQFVSGYVTNKTRSLFSFLPLMRTHKTAVGDFFFVRNKQLHPARRDLFRRDPEQMMRAFEIAQERGLDLSPELEDLLSRSLGQVTRTYQYARGPRAIFKDILSKKGRVGRILRMMHRVDFLGRYIPEFGQLTCLVQHEFLHRYTADEHTLVCIDKLDALTQTNDPKLVPYRKIFEKLEDPFVLYLALLLHDSGKAVGARPHSEASALFAQRVAARLQLSSEQRKSLILLVDHHLTLSQTAQQRNLDDPATVTDFAHIVKHQKNLNALMLLTLADGQGTSAEEWSDWKESLVWALFHETSRCLADQRSYYERTKVQRASLQASVTAKLPSDFAGEIEAHFEFMPDNYFRASDVPEIIEHLKLFRSFLENVSSEGNFPLAPAIQWKAVPEQGHTVVIFCTWERERLLAKVAGSFSVVPLNILSADIFPRGDNVVLCVFRVCDTKAGPVTHHRDVTLVDQTLRRALEDESFDFLPLIEKAKRQSHRLATGIEFPTRIAIDNKTHPVYALIEIQAPDRIGLLYDVLTCLDRENLLVPLSRINTQAGAAIDTLYVVNRSTRAKITDSHRIRAVQQRLQNAILGGGASKSK